MKKRQLKKSLNKKLRQMGDQQLIHLHLNYPNDKFWPLVDKEIRNRFHYDFTEFDAKFVLEVVEKTEGDVVAL